MSIQGPTRQGLRASARIMKFRVMLRFFIAVNFLPSLIFLARTLSVFECNAFSRCAWTLGIVLCLGASNAFAEKSPASIPPMDPAQCGPASRILSVAQGGPDQIELEADSVERHESRVQLRGDVRVHHGPWRADAETVDIEQEQQRAELSGNIRLRGAGIQIETERATLDYGRNYLSVREARYETAGGGRGTTERMEYQSDGSVEGREATYTTCALDNSDWHLSAHTVRVDTERAQGEARHAVLRVGSIPVMYLPWIGFPVGKERQSGWLVPTIGSSTDLGYSLETPYYFNLAPHYDAILSSRYMGRRGLQALPSMRYRTHHGGGLMRAEFLADQKMHDERYLLQWRHQMERDNLEAYTTYTDVSDRDYLQDYESGISGISRTRLRQEAHVIWRSENWRVAAALTGTDPLKDHVESWDRLPRIRAGGNFNLSTLGLQIRPSLAVDAFRGDVEDLSEYLRHPPIVRLTPEQRLRWVMNNDAILVPADGERYDVAIDVSRPFSGPGWQFTPRLQWRHTKYDLDYAEGLEGDSSPSRTLPTFSLDTRMRFERRTVSGDLQTLDPHLFYLNRPHREQRNLPRFDTRRLQPDYDALFREQEHSGLDRFDAADQLAFGIGTRIIDRVGQYMKFQAQLARIWYFRKPGENAEESNATHSAWAAQVRWRPQPQWEFSSSLRHDPGRSGSNTVWSWHQVDWRGAEDRHLQVRYVRRTGDYEQVNSQLLLPLGEHWQIAARYYYDMRNNRGLEQMIALEHKSCCITIGIGAWRIRRDSGSIDEDYDNRILLHIRFHGLAGFGEDLVGKLRRERDGEHTWAY